MKESWNELIHQLPQPHLLQSWQWGQIKADFGWKPTPLVWIKREGRVQLVRDQGQMGALDHPQAAALILQKGVPLGFEVMYIPKGPLLGDWSDVTLRTRVLEDLMQWARERRAIFLKIDPDIPLGMGVPGKENAQDIPLGKDVRVELKDRSWRFSSDQIQYRNTVLVDLTPSEDDILMRMKSKTRYNIRLAGRKGVTVRQGDRKDMELLYAMYAKTSVRGGFTIRGQDYYHAVWDLFFPSADKGEFDPVAVPLIAEVQGEAVAALVIFRFGDRAWYLHGMSTEAHREKMPTYLVQWEAMRWAKEHGCTVYDMWGAPDEFTEDDPLWGVYRFKRGFGGQVSRTIGAWDYPVKPFFYQAYNRILPAVLSVMREIGDRETEEIAADR